MSTWSLGPGRSRRLWRSSSRRRAPPAEPVRHSSAPLPSPPAAAWVYRKHLWRRSLRPEEVEAMCTLKMEAQGLDFGALLRPSAPLCPRHAHAGAPASLSQPSGAAAVATPLQAAAGQT